jgi:hypothetical protein
MVAGGKLVSFRCHVLVDRFLINEYMFRNCELLGTVFGYWDSKRKAVGNGKQ